MAGHEAGVFPEIYEKQGISHIILIQQAVTAVCHRFRPGLGEFIFHRSQYMALPIPGLILQRILVEIDIPAGALCHAHPLQVFQGSHGIFVPIRPAGRLSGLRGACGPLGMENPTGQDPAQNPYAAIGLCHTAQGHAESQCHHRRHQFFLHTNRLTVPMILSPLYNENTYER